MNKPTIPKGTRDFGPVQMAKREFIFKNIRKVFQKYGFQPLETPAMENLTTLTGKYGEEGDQLLFRILNSGDFLNEVDPGLLKPENARVLSPLIADKGLRYDLTVPFARYVVMNRHDITFPFKRYQMQPVWRADRPQKGRYREFYQCDADVVGTDSLLCEVDIVLMIQEIFSDLGIKDFTIKINHRGILSAMAEQSGAGNKESSLFVAIDKLDKIGPEKVKEELLGRGFTSENIQTLFQILQFKGDTAQKIKFLRETFSSSESGLQSVAGLEEVFALLHQYGASADHVEFDISLARGLSYYTGCIFEVKINQVAIGSVSGGGRYDNLTAVFDSRERSSGVGISFGVDRLYDAMEELKLFPEEAQIVSQVLVCYLDPECLPHALQMLRQLRECEIASEAYPDAVKLKKQIEYADRKGIPFVIVIGSDEVRNKRYTLKNMKTGDQEQLDIPSLINRLNTKP